MFYSDCSKHTRNKLLSYLLILLCVFVLPNYADAKRVKVGVYNSKPLVFKDEQGEFQGLSIDLLHYIAEQEGWELQFVEGSWQECLARLDAGEIDIQVAIAISDEREKVYSYSEQALIINWGKLFRHPDAPITSIIGLNGKTIALVDNDIHAQVFTDLIDKFDVSLRSVFVSSYDEVLEKVAGGEVDVGVVSRLYAMPNEEHYQVKATPMIFNPIEIHYAAPKGKNRDLLQAIDGYLKELREEKSSFYYQSLDSWFKGGPASAIPAWVKPALIASSGLLLGILFISFLLKRQVATKTKDLQTIFETSPAAIFVHDIRGRLLDMNSTMLKMYGVEKEEGLRLSVIDDYSSTENPLRNAICVLEKGDCRRVATV